ncbi:MAG: Ig-like domain-containing protein, partial [Myxococcota bacterium]
MSSGLRIGLWTLLLVGCTTEVEEPVTFVAGSQSLRLDEDSSAIVVLTAEARGTNAPITYEIVEPPTLGRLVERGPVFEYIGDTNESGVDSFTWKAVAGRDESDVYTFDVVVAPINDAPDVTPQALVGGEDQPLTGLVMADDVDGDPLTFRIDQPPRSGVVSIDERSGAFVYLPNTDRNGVDDFTVIASDGRVDSRPGRVTISVAAVNDAPRLAPLPPFTTNEDVAVSGVVVGLDVEGDTLTYTLVGPPSSGVATIAADTGILTYTPAPDFNGTDPFRVAVSDGSLLSESAVVEVRVLPVNDAPVPSPAALVTIVDGSTSGVLRATDPEGDSLLFLMIDGPTHGQATIDRVTGAVSYTPAPGYTGPDTVLWAASDGERLRTAELRITVMADRDDDGFGDLVDNCVDIANADQADANDNGVGDLCDCYTDDFEGEPDLIASSEWASRSPERST